MLPLPAGFGHKAARLLREDMQRAEPPIPYQDERGFADAHALRSYYVTELVRSGANPRLVMTLARHSTPVLTLTTYTRLRATDERQAVEALPSLASGPGPQSAQGTGTEGAVTSVAAAPPESGNATPKEPVRLSRRLSRVPSAQATSVDSGRLLTPAHGPVGATSREEVVSAPGIEPGTYWLKASCSTG